MRLKRVYAVISGILVVCLMLAGCGSMRGLFDMMSAVKGSLNDYEDKMLGYTMQIPYEWEIAEPYYFDNGGIARFDADPEIYGRDDLQMAVLYIPEASYTQSIENLRDFMDGNVLPQDNDLDVRIVEEGAVTKQVGDAYSVVYQLIYPKGGGALFKMYIVPSKEGLYVLHFNSGSNINERFIKEAEHAVDTFSIVTGKMTPSDYKISEEPYQNDTLGFRIEYIAGWKINEVEESGKGGKIELLPPVLQNTESKLTIIYTLEYGLSGATDAFKAAVKENHVKVKKENYVNAPNMQLAYGALLESKGTDGKILTTQLYIIPDEGNACYFAYYSWNDETYDKFVEECEINLRGFEITGSTMEGYVSTGYHSVISYGLDCDFTMFTTEKTLPDVIVEKYGEAREIKTEKLGGIEVTKYMYDAFVVDFIERDGKLEMAGLLNTSPESPIAVGGFQVGGDFENADDSLRANGYKAREAFSTDTEKYYSGKSLSGDTCLVIVYLKNNIVSKAQGWYGKAADEAIGLAKTATD